MREDSNGSYVSAEITVNELLDKAEFWETNAHFQELMDLNREILKEGLGLDDADVFAIPVLFSAAEGRADRGVLPGHGEPSGDRLDQHRAESLRAGHRMKMGKVMPSRGPSVRPCPSDAFVSSTTGTATTSRRARCTVEQTPVEHPSPMFIGGSTGQKVPMICSSSTVPRRRIANA